MNMVRKTLRHPATVRYSWNEMCMPREAIAYVERLKVRHKVDPWKLVKPSQVMYKKVGATKSVFYKAVLREVRRRKK